MRILLATGLFPPDIGGPATYSRLLVEEFPKRGIEVSVLSFGEVRKYPKVFRHFLYFVKCLSRVWKVDIVYAQDPVSVGLPALVASKLLRKPFVIRVAGDYAWEQAVQRHGVKDSIDDFQNNKYGVRTEFLRKIQKYVVQRAHKVITPSKYFQKLVSGWTSKKERVVCIYNGVDLKEPAIPKNTIPKTIFSGGRLVSWKGFDILIEVMRDLPEWKLTIVGSGPDEKKLKEKAKNLGVASRVDFAGSLPRPELWKRLAQSEIFVLNTSFESFSFQVVEAMIIGVPVITTNIGNLTEIIRDGQDGILVTPNDKGAILSAIEKISTDAKFREAIIDSAQKKASEEFFMDRVLSATQNLLETVVRETKQSHA